MSLEVRQIHLWIQNPEHSWYTAGIRNGKPHEFPGKQIIIEPSGQTVTRMKLDVANELKRWLGKIEYYYVVMVVEKSDGTLGYRTIVPKTVVGL